MQQRRHRPKAAELPALVAGAHEGPEHGGCFMEIASLLAGEPWSDRPRSTDPTLAVIARLVNDAISTPARERLTPLIPAVLDTNTADVCLPAALAQVAASVAAAYGAMAPATMTPPPLAVPDPPDRSGGWMTRARRAYRIRRVRQQAITVIVAATAELARLPTTEADTALTELLTTAIAAAREYSHACLRPPAPSSCSTVV